MPKLSSTPRVVRRSLHLALWLLACALLAPSGAQAQQHSHVFRWQVPPDHDVAGYRLYLRVTGASYPSFGSGIDLGSQAPDSTGVAFRSVGGFSDALEYRARLTAYDTSGNESALSNEVTIPAAACNASACDDGNPCTVDRCSSTGCIHTPAADGLVCDDGFANTIGDACFSGVCVGTVPQCTSDADCADGDVCDGTEQCIGGSCVAGSALRCSAAAQGACMVGTCDPQLGCTATPAADGTQCDDGMASTLNDTCTAGVCAGTPLSVSVTANRSFPVSVGTAITFNVTASGGGGALEYQFWVREASGRWVIIRPYATSASTTWTPSQAGADFMTVWVRSVGSSAEFDTMGSIPIQVQAASAPAPVTVGSVTANRSFPVSVGTAITFNVTASGGGGALEYQFWVREASGRWVIIRPYATSASTTWTPSQAGADFMTVWVRSVGSSAEFETMGSIPIQISPD
ncbi:MAG: hypothetical protein ACE5IL_14495 [Myxococcota bacterium]